MKRLSRAGTATLLLLSTSMTQAATLLGVYYGNQGWAMSDVSELENWQGKKNAVLDLYTNWTDNSANLLFTYQLPAIWANGNVPMITWEPYLEGVTPNDIETSIAQGNYDTYIDAWALQLRQFVAGADGVYGSADDRRVYLRLAHEMNGNWYPWSAQSNSNTPADYVLMWQRVYQRVMAQGLNNNHVQWIWSVNNTDAGSFNMEAYYPGDAYVDWVAIDGYNWGSAYSWSSWKTPAQIFNAMRNRLTTLAPTKPVAITEVASTATGSSGVDIAAKETWIGQFKTYIKNNDIRMVSWFNEEKETNWSMFAGQYGATQVNGVNVYPAYRTLVQDSSLIAPNTANLRLLTNAQFKGSF